MGVLGGDGGGSREENNSMLRQTGLRMGYGYCMYPIYSSLHSPILGRDLLRTTRVSHIVEVKREPTPYVDAGLDMNDVM